LGWRLRGRNTRLCWIFALENRALFVANQGQFRNLQPTSTAMNQRIILSLFLIISAASISAQTNSLKQPMFKDLKVTNSITKSYRDSTCVFHVAVIDENFRTDISKRYFWYHQGELRTTQGNFTGKLLHGTYEKFDRDGRLLEKGNFDNGLKSGQWVSWYSTGNIMRHYNWSSGQRTGKFQMYDPLGNRSVSGQFKHGQLDGNVYYYSNGAELRKEKYRGGKLVKAKEKKKVNEKEGTSKKKFRLWKRKSRKTDSLAVDPVKEKRTRKEKKNEKTPQEKMQAQPVQTPTMIEPQPASPKTEKKEPRRKKKQREEQPTSAN
jgi:hypothetical protein